MKRARLVLFCALPLAACATTDAGTLPTEPPAAESITFETGPCYGTCPVFAVTVSANGNGRFSGERFVVETQPQGFTATPAQYAAFRDRLAPFRPARSAIYGFDNCDGSLVSDHSTVMITWRDEDGAITLLNWYTGCRQPGLAEHAETIVRAWEELPIARFIGTPDARLQADRANESARIDAERRAQEAFDAERRRETEAATPQ